VNLLCEILIFSPFVAYALWPRARGTRAPVLRLPDAAPRQAPLELDEAEG
jgi:hypothetical protein